jgi:leucyl aminopeptidase
MPIPRLTVSGATPPAHADATVFVTAAAADAGDSPFAAAIAAHAAVDATLASAGGVLPCAAAAGGRLVVSPTGPLNRDYDDVRRVADAVAKGVKRAMGAGARAPHLHLCASLAAAGADYVQALTVALTAALGALYAPYSLRLGKGEAATEPVAEVSFWWGGAGDAAAAAATAAALEAGKRVCKDITGSDPEIAAPPKLADYCVAAFSGLPGVTVSVVSDPAEIAAGYPLLAAVSRASMPVPRHHPRIVRLEYTGEGAVDTQIMLVGKGVTYDSA